MDRFSHLKKIDNDIFEANTFISFALMNPTNLQEQKEAIEEDEGHNPEFDYDHPEEIDLCIDLLRSIDRQESPFGKLLEEQRKRSLNFARMLKYRGTRRFQKYNDIIYGQPDKALVAHAEQLVIPYIDKEPRLISSALACHKIRAELNNFGFIYCIEEKEMSASAAVSPTHNRISISKDRMFSENYVRRLLIHEVGTHVLRAENGKRQPFKMFISGFPGYNTTEEGLAAYNEKRFGLMNLKTLAQYGARTIAVHRARTRAFSEIYQELKEQLGEQLAYQTACRVKRGLKKTKRKGGCSKDYCYLDGFIKVSDFVSNGGDLRELYIGKIGVEHLPQLRGLPWLHQPKFLPKNQFFASLLSFAKPKDPVKNIESPLHIDE